MLGDGSFRVGEGPLLATIKALLSTAIPFWRQITWN